MIRVFKDEVTKENLLHMARFISGEPSFYFEERISSSLSAIYKQAIELLERDKFKEAAKKFRELSESMIQSKQEIQKVKLLVKALSNRIIVFSKTLKTREESEKYAFDEFKKSVD